MSSYQKGVIHQSKLNILFNCPANYTVGYFIFTKNEFVCKYFSTILLKSLILIITRLYFFENWKNSYFTDHMQMDASKLAPPLVYTTEAIDHYQLDPMSIVTLIACHLTHFHFTKILGYRYITSKTSQSNKDTLHFITLNSAVPFSW